MCGAREEPTKEAELEEVLVEERLGEPTNNQRERSPLGI